LNATIVLIVAKCIVNLKYKNLRAAFIHGINSSKVYCKFMSSNDVDTASLCINSSKVYCKSFHHSLIFRRSKRINSSKVYCK